LSVAAFLRRAGGSMLESTGSHVPEMSVPFSVTLNN